MEAEACKTPHSNRKNLKAPIRKAWNNRSKEYIVRNSKAFRPHLEAMIEANGGHIEGKTIDGFYDYYTIMN